MKKFKLNEITEIIGGGTPKTSMPEYWNGNIPWLSVVDFCSDQKKVYKTEKTITSKGLEESSTKILAKGQLIISARGTVGELAMLGKDMAFNQSCYGLNAIPHVATNDFLYYLLKFKLDEIKRHIHGAVFDTITKQTFQQIEITLPDLPTQSRIASILSSLDDKIELNRRMNQTLEQMAQAFFYEYCWQGESVKLIELIEFNPKLSFQKGQFGTYVEMGNLPIRGLSIENSIIRRFSGGSKFQNGDTLFARITPCLENGKTAFVDVLDKREIGFGSTEFIVLRAKENISSYFPYMIARDKNFREHAIKSMVGTSGRQRVQTEMLLSFEVPKCKNEQMNAFHEFANPIFLKIKANTKEIKTLSTIRDTLLPKLMSGEIDVSQLNEEKLIENYATENILNA